MDYTENFSFDMELNKENLNKESNRIDEIIKNKNREKKNENSNNKEISKQSTRKDYDKIKNSILFREIVDVLIKIEKCKGANSKDIVKEILSDLFITIIENHPQDLTKIYYFLSYKLGPSYLIPDLQIQADKLEELVIKLFNLSDNSLKDNLRHYGDLGQVASDIKQTNEEMNAFHNYVDETQKHKLTMAEIMTILEEAALEEETNDKNNKAKLIYNLMVKSDQHEIKFIIRFLEKNLKLGISQSTLICSVARAVSRMYKNTFEKDILKILLKCKNQIDDEDIIFGYVIEMIKNKTDFKRLIDLCHMRCGVPFSYQLADSSTGIKTMIKEIGKNAYTCENLYSGMRCQIHCNKSKIQIFNKSLEDITQKYPEIVGYSSIFITKSIEKNKKDIKSFILDCTFLPYDKKNDRSLNIQELTFFPKEIKIPSQSQEKPNNHICVFCFDILLFNGEILVNKTLRERRKILYSYFCETISFRFAKHIELEKTDKDEVDEFMSESLIVKCRGIIGKLLDKDSTYTPGHMNSSWLKINKSYYKAELDTLYFVIVGAKYGKGDRMRLYSSVLLACLNEDEDMFEALVLTNGALKNRQLDELLFHLKDHIIYYKPSNYKLGKYEPDVIFSPKVIVQVKTFFLCLNQTSAVGFGTAFDNFGVSIRFPRIIKIRDDRKINRIITSEKIIQLYKSQEYIKENSNNNVIANNDAEGDNSSDEKNN